MEVQIENLVKKYNDHTVLHIDELRIQKGSLCGVIGPNGAGKSTLLQLVGGLTSPTQGKMLYNGEKISKKIYQRMTVVFQNPYLLRSTVFENIAYPLILRKIEKQSIHTRVMKILEQMELEDLKDRRAWTLSGGEAQKVALARALIFDPDLLLLDEPTANIDPYSIKVMERMIRYVNEVQGTTVVMITHHIPQAQRLCKEVIFLDRGRLEEHGEADQVIFYTQNPRTKDFIRHESLI